MPITYTKLRRTGDQVHHEETLRGEEPCEPEEQEEGLRAMPRSSPIRVWELLRPGEALKAAELARQAGATHRQLRRALSTLRRRGQRVMYDRTTRTYRYFPSPPLRVVESACGQRLASEGGCPLRTGEVIRELE